jgi:hypothetical protein
MLVFGREPALIVGAASAAIQFVSAVVFPLSVEQQGALNGVVALLLGLVVAWKVSAEKAAAALVAVFQGLIAVGLAFGLDWSPSVQSAVMLLVTAAASFFVRTQVTAPVPARAAA